MSAHPRPDDDAIGGGTIPGGAYIRLKQRGWFHAAHRVLAWSGHADGSGDGARRTARGAGRPRLHRAGRDRRR
ncbi:protein of unknown function [Rhodovastum atsumiense]|nr:protein of unknown function [Rhodovastum atsumiense]